MMLMLLKAHSAISVEEEITLSVTVFAWSLEAQHKNN
jgi:hypothetical protein